MDEFNLGIEPSRSLDLGYLAFEPFGNVAIVIFRLVGHVVQNADANLACHFPLPLAAECQPAYQLGGVWLHLLEGRA